MTTIAMMMTMMMLLLRPESRGELQQEGVGARLAGQHFLSSPPDLHTRSTISTQDEDDTDNDDENIQARAHEEP